jgi:hypothetical protein
MRRNLELIVLGIIPTLIGLCGGFVLGKLDNPPQNVLRETVTPDYVNLNVKFATIYVSDKGGDWLLAFDDQASTKTASKGKQSNLTSN